MEKQIAGDGEVAGEWRYNLLVEPTHGPEFCYISNTPIDESLSTYNGLVEMKIWRVPQTKKPYGYLSETKKDCGVYSEGKVKIIEIRTIDFKGMDG